MDGTLGQGGGAAPRRRGNVAPWAAAALLAALAAGSLAPVLGNGFVQFDDQYYLTEHPRVRAGLTADNVLWALTSLELANWFPLTRLSQLLDAELYGLAPGGHHLTSLLLHVAATLALFAGLRALTGATWRSAFAAALFAAHPLHVETVAWASERKGVLAGLLWMLALVAYERYARRPQPGRYLAVAACAALGLMSKAVLVTLPFALLLLDLWPLGRWRPGKGASAPPGTLHGAGGAWRLLLEKAPLLALSAGASVVAYIAQRRGGAISTVWENTFGIRAATALHGWVRYLGKTVWPADLSVFYPYHMGRTPPWSTALAGAALAAATVLALYALRRRPWLAAGWLWYLGTLLPTIGIIQVGVQSMADRYTYIPLVGLFLALAWGADELAGRVPHGRAVATCAAVGLLAVLAPLAWVQAGRWRSTVTLFRHALAVTPDNVTAHVVLGRALGREGRREEGDEHLRAALRINSNLREVNALLALSLMRAGRRDEAMAHFREELRINPAHGQSHFFLATLLAEDGRAREAAEHYRELLRRDPGNFYARLNLGRILAGEGAWAGALEQFRAAAAIDPSSRAARAGAEEAAARLAGRPAGP